MKAQIISMDLFIALVIIMGILVAFGFIIADFTEIHELEMENREMQIRGQAAINALLYPPAEAEEVEE